MTTLPNWQVCGKKQIFSIHYGCSEPPRRTPTPTPVPPSVSPLVARKQLGVGRRGGATEAAPERPAGAPEVGRQSALLQRLREKKKQQQ